MMRGKSKRNCGKKKTSREIGKNVRQCARLIQFIQRIINNFKLMK